MKFVHSLTVSRNLRETQAAFRDMEMLAGCLPGASVETLGDQVTTGRAKVKVGPIVLTYRGEVREIGEPETDSIRFVADAKEVKGLGDANATIRLDFTSVGRGTDVKIRTDLDVSGRLTQFGGGVIADVADQIFDDFVVNLRRQLGDSPNDRDRSAGGDTPAPGGSIDALSYLARPARERLPTIVAVLTAFLLGWMLREGRARRRSFAPSATTRTDYHQKNWRRR